MPPKLALLGCLVLIYWMFRQDLKRRHFESKALWIPFLWLLISGSRPVGAWFGSGSATDPGNTTVDLLSMSALMGASIIVLFQRQMRWGDFAAQNKALLVMYLFFAISMMWAEHPFVALKRVCKDFGCVLVALVFLAQKNPLEAIRTVYVRCSYILFPLSVITIKYFPTIGRRPLRSGDASFGGLTVGKNSLGLTVLVFGLILVLDLILLYREHHKSEHKTDKRINVAMLLCGLWLLQTCDSKTSLVCLVIGSPLLLLSSWYARLRRPRLTLAAMAGVVCCCIALDGTLDISGQILTMLGRNKTLTGRTEIWRLVKAQHTDPILGCGFRSFWDGQMGKEIGEEVMVINEAHNGYLEEYIDGGIVGVALFAIMLLSFGKTAVDGMARGTHYGGLAFAVCVIAILYNFSETDYFRLSSLWLTLLLVCIEPQPWRRQAEQVEEAAAGTAEALADSRSGSYSPV